MKAGFRASIASSGLLSLILSIALSFVLLATSAMSGSAQATALPGGHCIADCHSSAASHSTADYHSTPCAIADRSPSLCEHTALTTDCCAQGLIALPMRWHAAHLPLDSPLRPQPLDDARSLILAVPQRPPTALS